MIIKILGSGCINFKKSEKNTRKVIDVKYILSCGVMKTAIIVVDGKVKTMKRVL